MNTCLQLIVAIHVDFAHAIDEEVMLIHVHLDTGSAAVEIQECLCAMLDRI